MAYATNLAGSKLRAKLGTSLNEHVSAPTSGFARQQLHKMGWSEGDGLGKIRQGRTSHITVKRREDNVGLGHNYSTVPSHTHTQWWKDSICDTLAKLGGRKKRKRDYTDEELFQATGGARFGMRAQRRAEAKWARTESQTEEDEREALSRVEWNGQGAAEIKLAGEERNPTKGGESNVSHDSANRACVTESTNTKKKRKKNDFHGEEKTTSLSSNETFGLVESKKKKKKRSRNNGDRKVSEDANEAPSDMESKKQRKKNKKAKKSSKKPRKDKKKAEATD